MKISVAMATYNGEKYLDEQLQSLAEQTRLPDELVVIDDCSTDRTFEIVKEFALNSSFPVRIFRNDNKLGYSDNFLKAAKLCTSDWIAFCDQDDIWLPEKLELVLMLVGKNPDAVLVVHPAIIVDENLNSTGIIYPRLPRRHVLYPLNQPIWFKVQGFCCSFDAALVHQFPHIKMLSHFFDRERMQAHDRRIPWLANIIGKTLIIGRPMALYRRHERNVSDSLEAVGRSHSLFARSRNDVNFDQYRSQVAREYADALDAFAYRKVPPEISFRLKRGATYYRRMSSWYAVRAKMAFEPRWRRPATLAYLIALGAYQGRGGAGLGIPSLLKDLVELFSKPYADYR